MSKVTAAAALYEFRFDFFFLSIYNIMYTRVYKIQVDIVDVRAYMCLVRVQLKFSFGFILDLPYYTLYSRKITLAQ